jgi:hypothetical protein
LGANGVHPRPGRPVDLAFGAQPVEQAAGRHHRLDTGPRPARGQAGGDLLGGLFRLVGDAVHQAEGERLVGLNPPAGQRDIEGRAAAGQVGQNPGAHRQVQARGPDPAQPRARTRDPDVRRRGQLRTAADRRPGDHGDHRPGPGHDGLASLVNLI